MGENHENLLKIVRHCQESLDRHTENRNDVKLLHYLEKLYKLPIRVVHLEETGVGRTVNGLRKLGGDVGDSAKSLVAKWKEMVVGEQEEEEDDEDEEEEDEDEDGYQTGEDQSTDSDDGDSRDEQVNETSSSHRKSDSNRTDDTDRSKEKKYKHGSSNSEKEVKNDSRKEREKHHKHNGHAKHKPHKRKSESSSSEDETPRKNSKRSDDEDRYKRKHSVESDNDVEGKTKEKKHKSDKHRHKKNYEESSTNEERQNKTSKSKYKHRENNSRDKHKSSTSSSSTTTNNNNTNKNKKEDSKKHEYSRKSKDKDKKNKHRDKNEDNKVKTSKTKVLNESFSRTGIDSGSGASFAEALGMCEPSSSKNTSKKKSFTEKKEKNIAPKASEESVPKLLKESNLEPIDLSSLLPPITPNYRPLGNYITSEAQPRKYMSEAEALANIITSKNQRTKVYSGNKVGYGKVPSLFELCTRVLQDNIDALEYTGGVPYCVLKPILEKANANQLYVMEHHNPYLIEDTDELWQLHCQKEFRNKKREELETWREMYLRCLDERDAKLKALTANIKQAQDKSLPVRMTKLAYVDAVAKPPRNIARKQAKNGTAFDYKKPTVTPSARLASIAASSGEAGKVAVPNPGSRAVDRSGGHAAAKHKKAPLMLKSITSFKNRFKR